MKYCSHCGKELADDVKVCMGCGCLADITYTVSLKRESQFFLINPPINVRITGENYSEEKAIRNGETLELNLAAGRYHLHFYASVRKADVDLNVTGNTAVRIAWNRFSGKLEAWEI